MIDIEKLRRALARDLHLDWEAVAFPTEIPLTSKDDAVAEFKARYQLYNLTRKISDGTVSETHRSQAFEKFLSQQKSSETFNESEKLNYQWVEVAKDIIHKLLPPLDFVEEDLWPMCKFGPGTFNGAHETYSYSLHYKIGHDQFVTVEAKGLFLHVVKTYFPAWAERLSRWGRRLHTVDGNRLSHVFKDEGSCRPIAIEPSANVFLQQGIGRWLMSHMRKTGFADLKMGQERNRNLAKDLRNGTIDLSSASDTINMALVRTLFPPDWFALLDCTRSKRWKFRSRKGTYHNLSSQGNAFTFPVETLIFKAIVMAATGLSAREVTVYGDDIIVPCEYCPSAVKALEEAGFTVNSQKSYWGQHDDCRKYFRESCGADYLFGESVNSVFIRRYPRSLSELAVIYNRIAEEWPGAHRALSFILLSIPPELRKKVQIGPSAFITDEPDRWVSNGDKRCDFALNSVVRTYSNWFWDVGPLASSVHTGRAWVESPRKLKQGLNLGPEVSETVFIYGGEDSLPRSTNRRTIRANVTPWFDPVGGVDWRRIKGLP